MNVPRVGLLVVVRMWLWCPCFVSLLLRVFAAPALKFQLLEIAELEKNVITCMMVSDKFLVCLFYPSSLFVFFVYANPRACPGSWEV